MVDKKKGQLFVASVVSINQESPCRSVIWYVVSLSLLSQGFPSCSYYFQPQLSIRRAVDTPILTQTSGLPQTAGPDRPARLK